MSKFIKEYWLWMLVPALVLLGLLAVGLYLAGEDSGDEEFIYNIYGG